jgi:hypothetical protein
MGGASRQWALRVPASASSRCDDLREGIRFEAGAGGAPQEDGGARPQPAQPTDRVEVLRARRAGNEVAEGEQQRFVRRELSSFCKGEAGNILCEAFEGAAAAGHGSTAVFSAAPAAALSASAPVMASEQEADSADGLANLFATDAGGLRIEHRTGSLQYHPDHVQVSRRHGLIQ